jgi:ribonuclease HII
MAVPSRPTPAHADGRVVRVGSYGLFDYDRAHGRLVAGCDEAGRACFAGPLVAAAVLFDYDRLDEDLLAGLNDSKKLTPARREALYGPVLGCAARVAVVMRTSRSIDVHGLQRMNLDALHRSLVGVAEPGCVLIADGDGCKLPPVGAVEPLNLVRGDSTSAAVAAASIVAKVTRDRLMSRAAERWPGYGFERHYGYGTRQHREAIARLGPCPLHRRSCRGVCFLAAVEYGEVEDDEESGTEPVEESRPKKSASPDLKSLPNPEKLEYLLEKTTIPDRVHTDEQRLPKESRADFLRRIYG